MTNLTNAPIASQVDPVERLPTLAATQLAFSIAQTCQMTSLGRTAVFGLIKDGTLRVVRVGRRTLVLAESLHVLLGITEHNQR